MAVATVPESVDEVTPQWLTAALRRCWPAICVTEVRAVPLGEGIGQMSVLRRLELEHHGAPDAPRSMVVKLHTPHPDMRSVGERYRMFEREVNFYQRFAARVPINTPDVYYAELDGPGKCVLLMQDMSSWHTPDQIKGPALREVESAIDQLAGLTGAFWGSPVLNAEASWLPDWGVDYMRAVIADYRACLPEFLRRFGARLPDGSAAAARRIAARIDALADTLKDGVQVLTHYDYRIENMFFRNGQPDFCIVDWQLVVRARPGWDFAYLVATNLPVEFRHRHVDALKQRYLSALAANGVVGYTRDDFERDVALNTMAMTIIPVIGGANADLSIPRNEELFATIGNRAMSAVTEGNCLDVLP
jgi:Phosphotransferase enzyme family